MARMALIDIWRSTLIILGPVRKAGESNEITTQIMKKDAVKPYFWNRTAKLWSSFFVMVINALMRIS
jgi:hypothetical protein